MASARTGRQLVRGVIVGATLLWIVDAVAVRMGRAPGALPTVLGLVPMSRALGVTAFLALTLVTAFGLLSSMGALDRFLPRKGAIETHRWLSASALVTTALHAVVLAVDRSVRFDALDVLVPFLSSWRPVAVGLGVLAAWLAVMVHGSDAWRRVLGATLWRRVHYLAYASFALALTHGIVAAPDDGPRWLGALYGGSALLVLGLTVARVAVAGAGRPLARTTRPR